MLRHFLKFIKDNDLFKPCDKVVVGLSGGADSIALVDLLLRGGWKCIACHCNFHLRGEESNRDETFVRDFCQKIQERYRQLGADDDCLQLYVKHFEVLEIVNQNPGESIEMLARDLRYRWFCQMASEHNVKYIATAHHANDQAETVLLNLLRGAGIRGLQGIKPKRLINLENFRDSWCNTTGRANDPLLITNGCDQLGCDKEKSTSSPTTTPNPVFYLIRPLLFTTHEHLKHYLENIRHLNWVEDSTNGDICFKRNRIRFLLKDFSETEIMHIAQTAMRVQGYVDIIENRETLYAEQVRKYEKLNHKELSDGININRTNTHNHANL